VAEARADLLDLTILRPAGRAWAVSVGVAEPHAFLRERFRPLLESLEPWAEACGWQSYIELRDSERQPALVRARSLSGMSQVRPDVRCCSPLLTRGAALFAPPAPPCPVFGRDVGCCRRLPP
jgi:hypothetical protein